MKMEKMGISKPRIPICCICRMSIPSTDMAVALADHHWQNGRKRKKTLRYEVKSLGENIYSDFHIWEIEGKELFDLHSVYI